MDYSKVKLVAVDMDGTLLNSRNEVSDRFLEVYQGLQKKSIHLVVASGRQYQSIVDKLYFIKNEITIIAENGGVVKQVNKDPVLIHLSQKTISDTLKLLRKLKGTYIVFCGEKSAYVESAEPRFTTVLNQYFPKHTIVSDLSEVSNDKILKISAYHFDSSETNIYPAVMHLERDLQVTVSAQHWLDISHANANKGHALNIVQSNLKITKEETMAFGDYNNDLKMLERAYFSFAMENAHPNVKKTARFQTKSNNEQGVEFILSQLI